jgi:hypothetical protein
MPENRQLESSVASRDPTRGFGDLERWGIEQSKSRELYDGKSWKLSTQPQESMRDARKPMTGPEMELGEEEFWSIRSALQMNLIILTFL